MTKLHNQQKIMLENILLDLHEMLEESRYLNDEDFDKLVYIQKKLIHVYDKLI